MSFKYIHTHPLISSDSPRDCNDERKTHTLHLSHDVSNHLGYAVTRVLKYISTIPSDHTGFDKGLQLHVEHCYTIHYALIPHLSHVVSDHLGFKNNYGSPALLHMPSEHACSEEEIQLCVEDGNAS